MKTAVPQLTNPLSSASLFALADLHAQGFDVLKLTFLRYLVQAGKLPGVAR